MKPKQPLGCWHLLRWFVASIIIILVTAWISIGLPFAAISRTLVDRAHLKYWLLASGIYQQPVTVLSDVIVHTSPEDSPLVPVAEQAKQPDSAVGQALATVIYPTFVQHTTQTIINATYDWLEGKTTRPEFTIALLPNDTAATTVTQYLPVEATDTATVIQLSTIRSEQLPLSEQASKTSQQAFAWLVILPGIVVAGSLIGIVLLLLIIPQWRKSFMTVGVFLLSLGGIMAITDLVLASNFRTVYQLLFSSAIPPQGLWLESLLQAPVQLAYNDMITRLGRYSLALASLGGILLLLALLVQLPWHQFRKPKPRATSKSRSTVTKLTVKSQSL